MDKETPLGWEWRFEGHVEEGYDVRDEMKEMMCTAQWGQLPTSTRYVLKELIRSRTELKRITAAVENLATLVAYVVDRTYPRVDEERLATARTHATARYRMTPTEEEKKANA